MINILDTIRDFFRAIREIDKKYKTPHIKMTRLVSLSLLLLRIYLLSMVGILLYKFITVVVH